MRYLGGLVLVVVFSLACRAGAGVPAFEAGDRVVFIGDSITHGGRYHADVYLFYATRFPDRKFRAYNCGVSGDTAPGANRRFEDDIAVHRPNVASIMFGMNDAWAWCFPAEGGPDEKQVAGRKNAYDTFVSETDRLAASLDERGCRLILVKPSIYDQTAELERANNLGKNDLIVAFGEYLETLAEQYDGSVVDFTTPMLEINAELQAADPRATVVGRDRVHPGEPGHLVMAYTYLKAQHIPGLVSAIELDVAGQSVETLENCSIEGGVEFAAEGLSFTCLENALPFPVRGGAEPALDWVPFVEELNQQRLVVAGLPAGRYALRIDGADVGTYSAELLAGGINLAENPATPQYRQALRVREVLEQRLAVTGKLRSVAHVRHSMVGRLDPPVDESDAEGLRAALHAHVEKSRGESWHGYLRDQAATYLEVLPEEADLRAEEERLIDRLWEVNRPTSHRWRLTRVDQD